MTSLLLAFSMAIQVASGPRPLEVQFAQGLNGRSVNVVIDGRVSKTSFAGKLGFRDRNRAWQSLCADVRAPMTNGTFFVVRQHGTQKFGGRVRLAGNIVARYFNAARTPDQCAGLQLAIWEAIEDGGGQADFQNGRFRASASAPVLAFAATYYSGIEIDGDAVFLLPEDNGQDGEGGGQAQISSTT